MKQNLHNRLFFILTLLTFFILRSDNISAQFQPPGDTEKKVTGEFAKNATATLKGRVIWDKQDLTNTTVQVYKDENLKELYTVGILKNNQFKIRVGSGNYYLVAFVDTNHSGKFDAGDGMGIYGITDWNASDQQKQIVKIDDRQTISRLEIIITARTQTVDGQNKIIPIQDYRADPLEEFKKELSLITSGFKGTVKWKGTESVENGLVFAYTDLSWKYRVGVTKVEKDGSFTLHLTPGKYYLMAVIDQNQTNLFDQGDELGIYGISDLRDRKAFPKPVLIEPNKLTEGMEIEIVGKQIENGQVISLDEGKMAQQGSEKATAQVSGKVIWKGQTPEIDSMETMIEVYRDATLMEVVQQTKTDADGKFSLQLPPGDYYLMANADTNGDGRYSQGDGLGSYGTFDITTHPPSMLTLKQGANPDIAIAVSARYNASGQLEAIKPASDIPSQQHLDSGISGRIVWDGKKFQGGILSLSAIPNFQSAIPIALNLEADGSYQVAIPPGDYYVMAVVDLDGDKKAGLQDGVGIYGTHRPVRGEPQLVSVFPGYITPYININILAVYIDVEGNIAELEDGHRSEIKLQYGDPEDVFNFTRFGRQIEEWWYWTQGVHFSFETIGAGWKLRNRKDFEPKVNQEQLKQLKQQLENPEGEVETEAENIDSNDASRSTFQLSRLNALIYYSFDDVIWGYAPNGILQPLGVGRNPTAAMDGRLTFIDLDGNVITHDSEAPEGRLLLSRRELATETAISPDGKYLAYVKRSIGRQRIYIRHLSSQQEIPVPSTAKEMLTPRWSLDGELLVYSIRGSIENPDAGTDRNIYAYDRVSERIEPIRIGPEDDSDPVWSPSDRNLVAFSRAEGRHRQIWVVRFSPKGESTEKQLTQYGGKKPVWLPDGSGILYENNGQLWVISKDGEENLPAQIKGKVIFGHEPYAIPFQIP